MSEQDRDISWQEFEQKINSLTDSSMHVFPEKDDFLFMRGLVQHLDLTDFRTSGAPSERLFWWARTVRQIGFEQLSGLIHSRITVSLTSYPARIMYVEEVLRSLMAQTRRADEIILWLAGSQFPNKEEDLPEKLVKEAKEGNLTIRWCEDLKPHKKYFFAMREIREGVVITVDDDLILRKDGLELLFLSYLRHPDAISSLRVHLMAASEKKEFLPYIYWIRETDALVDVPCLQLMATTGAGTLYPAGILSESVFDEEGIRKTCLLADDLWLKCHEIISNTPTVLACCYSELEIIPGTQEDALWNTNRTENDAEIKAIIGYLNGRFGEGCFEQHFYQNSYTPQTGIEAYSFHAWHQINRRNEENRRLKKRCKELETKLAALRDRLTESDRQAQETIGQLKESIEEIRNSLSYRLGHHIIHPFQHTGPGTEKDKQ